MSDVGFADIQKAVFGPVRFQDQPAKVQRSYDKGYRKKQREWARSRGEGWDLRRRGEWGSGISRDRAMARAIRSARDPDGRYMDDDDGYDEHTEMVYYDDIQPRHRGSFGRRSRSGGWGASSWSAGSGGGGRRSARSRRGRSSSGSWYAGLGGGRRKSARSRRRASSSGAWYTGLAPSSRRARRTRRARSSGYMLPRLRPRICRTKKRRFYAGLARARAPFSPRKWNRMSSASRRKRTGASLSAVARYCKSLVTGRKGGKRRGRRGRR